MSDFRDDYSVENDDYQEDPPVTYPINCTNVPDSLFDNNGNAAKDHFGKFGTITKILLRPSKKSCIIEFENRNSAEKAILNAGAYDGFMFNVTWSKNRRRPKVDDDPEWLPDPDVEAELKAMSGGAPKPSRLPRQQKMAIDNFSASPVPKRAAAPVARPVVRPGIVRKKTKPVDKVKQSEVSIPLQPLDKEELHMLITRPWLTATDKLKALEIRDKIIRSRLSARKGAIQGCCPDMCSERERLLRDTQRQVASFEFDDDTGNLDPKKAVKQYSRSSADQEEPLAHELRPISVLQDSLLYLLNYIVDSFGDEASIGDWFHFMWDRLRAIRKDITQQNLTCEGSVALVEACARFHAHCAARLVEEPPSSFDQRLNTENLSKCLQSLKYMYGDLRAKGLVDACQREPEFRAYVILLNMNDANFMWEVQRLDSSVLSSSEVRFAIKMFIAYDNNHYIKFFKLVRETTYLNACILLRYFNNVRARALLRIMKTYSPRGTSQFPAQELMDMLGFESLTSMELFLENYGLQVVSDQHSSSIILSRNSFHDNDTPSVQERAIDLVESKLDTSLGEVIYGNILPDNKFDKYAPHSSFDSQGYFNKAAILAQDQGFKPNPETVKEVMNLIDSLSTKKIPVNEYKHVDLNAFGDKKSSLIFAKPEAPIELPQNIFSTTGTSLFKKAQEAETSPFKKPGNFVFSEPGQTPGNVFGTGLNKTDPSVKTNAFEPVIKTSNIFQLPTSMAASNPFKSSNLFTATTASSGFGVKPLPTAQDLFKSATPLNLFTNSNQQNTGSMFDNKPFVKPSELFKTAAANNVTSPSSLFASAVNQQFIVQTKENDETLKQKELEQRKREEEIKRKEEEEAKRKKEEENRIIQEKIKEEMRRQEEIKRKIEEEKQILEKARRKAEEAKRAAELEQQRIEFERKEIERKRREFETKIEEEIKIIVPDIINQVVKEECDNLSKEAFNWLEELAKYSDQIAEELIQEMCKYECIFGIKSAVRLRDIRLKIICRSTIKTWRNHVGRSKLRRLLLHTTPTWLPTRPLPKAEPLQDKMFQRMRDFHRRRIPILKVPERRDFDKINLYKTVKKSLFQRSQQLNKTKKSLAIYWKVVMSAPDFDESIRSSIFFSKWLNGIFGDEQSKSKPDHVLYLSENVKFSKFIISICNVEGSSLRQPQFREKTGGWNGILFYGETQCLHSLTKRIDNIMSAKCPYEKLPVAIVIVLNSKSNNLAELQNVLELYKESRVLHQYKIFQVQQMNEDLLCSATKAALNWLAKNYPTNPCIKGEALPSFLDSCIGSELWYRFTLAQKSSVRKAFEDIDIITHLYNEAVDKTINIACNKSLLNYPVFASEFVNFININDAYPKDYQQLSPVWKSNLTAIHKILNNFKIRTFYKDSYLPDNFISLKEKLTDYIKKLDWFKDPENVILKVLCAVKEIENTTCPYSWLEIMNSLVKFKIMETEAELIGKDLEYKRDSFSNAHIVVYQHDDLCDYRSTPWWYSSKYTQSICPELIPLPDDDSDLEYDHSMITSKKIKLDDSSLEESQILDEKWLSSVLLDIDTSMNEKIQCKNTLLELDKTLESERQKEEEFKSFLRAALDEG